MLNIKLEQVEKEINKLEYWCKNKNQELIIKKILEINENLDFINQNQNIDKIYILSPLLKYFSYYIHYDPRHTINKYNLELKRETTKFIIQNNNFVPLLLNILKHKNIYRINWEDGLPYQEITSIYMDNKDFDIYTDRINKKNGNSEFRWRMYSSDKDSSFIEKKTHYSNKESTKYRVKLDLSKNSNMLNNNYIEDLDITEITKKKQKPIILTKYKRFYFQNSESSNIRVTLDTDIKGKKIDNFMYPYFNDGDDTYTCEYSVMEIKLTDCKLDDIPWLKEIINSELICKDPKYSKYSKFISTMYYFYNYYNIQQPDWEK